ncbi:piggyBac transposable element-derived protein 4-like [Anastrepha obliqua]|uniref:piggyBac transposable element-derived protein 4-like n=1 Tax=Anastrepha obliqua TaxID=95512 RepID=UPI00240A1734|nr:piggyBac transposable element-derived protein 4-like [Anastrepha obliqua]
MGYWKLLKMLHFNNNEDLTENRLHKLSPLIKKLRESFQQHIIPSEYVCIDETLVPFRGRLKFRQYIANKRHTFGIKLFKLCLEYGYPYDFKVYCGKSKDENMSVPSKVVMDLMEKLLDQGRTL